MICEIVLVAALSLPPRPMVLTPPRRVCLAALLRRAAREHAVVIDLRAGKRGAVYQPSLWRDAL